MTPETKELIEVLIRVTKFQTALLEKTLHPKEMVVKSKPTGEPPWSGVGQPEPSGNWTQPQPKK